MSNEKEKTAFLQSPFAASKPAAVGGDAVLLAIYPTGSGMGRRFALNKPEHVDRPRGRCRHPARGGGAVAQARAHRPRR